MMVAVSNNGLQEKEEEQIKMTEFLKSIIEAYLEHSQMSMVELFCSLVHI